MSLFQTNFPNSVQALPANEVLKILDHHFGARFRDALDPSVAVKSPVSGLKNTQWLKTAKTVGINVRTLGSFWQVIPYALTLPEAQNAIHLLPIWEPGVVASLYGPCSWHINPEFYSAELAALQPQLNTVDRQLRVVINLLHLLGKAVGMDVVPHTDRFSEMAIGQPQIFEWLQRRDDQILRHDSGVFETVQEQLFRLLGYMGPAVQGMTLPAQYRDFFESWPESDRNLALFGKGPDYAGRLARRKFMIQMLYEQGYETVPATMGPPYRGIEVDPSPAALVRDEEGRVWRDYRITKPQAMSRVFGPLARYKLYEPVNDNRDWALDFDRPNLAAWDYACRHYGRIQAEFDFDFMRGDMSHVQMRPEGVPEHPGPYYDLLGAVKQHVLREKPYYGYFAESFLAPAGEMAYGDECDHLEASFADSTLGDLQSEPIGTRQFMQHFARYRDLLENRTFAPNFTIMTADKDDPRFDSFYLKGNALRYFMALFLTDMPSYMSLGFECRDPHPAPAENEYYTKLYVFHLPDGPKGTRGPWKWGNNAVLYRQLVRQKELAAGIFEPIRDAKVRWIIGPDPTGAEQVLVWTQQGDARYIFAANLDCSAPVALPPEFPPNKNWQPLFSTETETPTAWSENERLILLPGEGRVWSCD